MTLPIPESTSSTASALIQMQAPKPRPDSPVGRSAAQFEAHAPTPEQIRSRRVADRLTQTRAAALIFSSKRTWQDWEAGIARMHPGLWELFVLKTSDSANPSD